MICCEPRFIFSEEFHTSYGQLLGLGVVSCYEEYCYIVGIIEPAANHVCHLIRERCMQRKGVDGELICRVKNRPYAVKDFFMPEFNIYSE